MKVRTNTITDLKYLLTIFCFLFTTKAFGQPNFISGDYKYTARDSDSNLICTSRILMYYDNSFTFIYNGKTNDTATGTLSFSKDTMIFQYSDGYNQEQQKADAKSNKFCLPGRPLKLLFAEDKLVFICRTGRKEAEKGCPFYAE